MKIKKLPPALKATFSFVLIQSVILFVLIVLSIILMQRIFVEHAYPSDPYFHFFQETNALVELGETVLPISIFNACTSALGILAVLYWRSQSRSYGLLVAFVVLQSVVLAYSLLMSVPIFIGSSRGLTYCNDIKSLCESCDWNVSVCCAMKKPHYEVYCERKMNATYMVAPLTLLNTAISFAAIVSGSVSAKIIKQKLQTAI
eukprot:TRINITY_DN3747_c0_g2_i1.p1 TRINITY_DN3747_c0_g2~~TRINITY_DN3747_c0_g2_i1.p1  ORF type:complete len:202 (-),score=11.43 TRINITY_DN3747_c0_g2_i1:51-656(-)